MSHISSADVAAFSSSSSAKLDLSRIDTKREQIESALVLGKLQGAFDTTQWTDSSSTPSLVRYVIAMYYVADFIDSTVFEDAEEVNGWSKLLRSRADELLEGIISGSIQLIDLPMGSTNNPRSVSFYPDDASSDPCATYLDPYDTSLGPAKFSMGQIF